MIDVFVLTSAWQGTASAILPYLLDDPAINVKTIIFDRGHKSSRRKDGIKKLRKLTNIGPLGALNGVRMRRWYGDYTNRLLKPATLEDIGKKFNIQVEQTDKVNCDFTCQLMRNSGATLGLSLGNGYISQRVFSVPPLGMLNVHHEILPLFQGAQSIIWQLYEGSNQTGFTIHEIDSAIDTGDILYVEKMDIEFKDALADTVSANYARLVLRSGSALARVLSDYSHYHDNAVKQVHGKKYTTPSFRQFQQIRRNFSRLRMESLLQQQETLASMHDN